MPEDQEFLTLDEAAAFLRVSPSTIRNLCRAGKLPFFKIGARYRFSKETLRDFFKKQEQASRWSHRID